MKIAMIVAMDEQGVIGKDNDLPWKISADLQFFKLNHFIISPGCTVNWWFFGAVLQLESFFCFFGGDCIFDYGTRFF